MVDVEKFNNYKQCAVAHGIMTHKLTSTPKHIGIRSHGKDCQQAESCVIFGGEINFLANYMTVSICTCIHIQLQSMSIVDGEKKTKKLRQTNRYK